MEGMIRLSFMCSGTRQYSQGTRSPVPPACMVPAPVCSMRMSNTRTASSQEQGQDHTDWTVGGGDCSHTEPIPLPC